MAKLFVPFVRWPVCSHASDSDFRFCQHCGYTRKNLSSIKKSVSLKVDLDSLDKRLQQLLNFDQATSYSKQKNSLRNKLEALAQSVTPLPSFIIARDQAYFKTFFFSGDRPGYLGQVKVAEILRFPNDDGFLFNHIWERP